MKSAIWWIRRDVRLHDQQALRSALDGHTTVLPVFIQDPALMGSPYFSDRRWQFLLAGLRELDSELKKRGSRLFFFQGSPLQILSNLISDGYASHIFAEEDITPFAKMRDRTIKSSLPATFTSGLSLMPFQSVTTRSGGAYHVYTPFRNALLGHPLLHGMGPLATPEAIPLPDRQPESLSIPDAPVGKFGHFKSGEIAGLEQLEAFTSGAVPPIYGYAEGRNGLFQPGTSHLSPYFRFGMLSVRSAFQAASNAISRAETTAEREAAQTWQDQLIWREFFIHILDRYPDARKESFRPAYRSIPWINARKDFEAWKEGRTGYPIVDAAMRQLREEGWIPNRARMVVASFLVKHLLIDWRWGEKWFMQQLLDGDPAQNNGGWQWSAGTGTDAAPYFRIFNPTLQSKRYDADGRYIRQYVPELSALDSGAIHEPWKRPAGECGGYPDPIVEHRFARERALAAFAKVRKQSTS